jgi:pimeloyl-ACP methyl ester carboxylesterase
MATDTADLCGLLGIKHAHFVGNSMGGFMLQALAYQYPALVKSGVISNSAVNAHCVFHLFMQGQLALLKANAPLPALLQTSSAWAFSYRFLAIPGMLEQLINFGLSNPYPFSIAGFEGQYAAIDAFDATTWVREIKAPMLVITGDQDLIIKTAAAASLAKLLPNAEYYCFNECGHLPMLEYEAEFAEKVITFVSSQ